MRRPLTPSTPTRHRGRGAIVVALAALACEPALSLGSDWGPTVDQAIDPAQGGQGGDERCGAGGADRPWSSDCQTQELRADPRAQPALLPVCCDASPDDNEIVNETLVLLNEARSARQLARFEIEPPLSRAAQAHAVHWSLDDSIGYTTPYALIASTEARASACGSSATAERMLYITTADGTPSPSPQTVVDALLGDPRDGFSDAALDPSFGHVGVGQYQARFVVMFAP